MAGEQVVREWSHRGKFNVTCPNCGLSSHDRDASHCKACGHVIYQKYDFFLPLCDDVTPALGSKGVTGTSTVDTTAAEWHPIGGGERREWEQIAGLRVNFLSFILGYGAHV